jgi:hypothetical protein
MAELDRFVNTYDLEWPGHIDPNATVNASAFHFYSPDTDPTHTVRAQGAALLRSLANASTAPAAGLASAAAAQFYCDPDWWGAYLGFSSPENPNFFTDWSKLCLGWSLALALRAHPRAAAYCALARGVWELDLAHSVALPSGAGQESPGYTAHALASWLVEAPLLDALCPNATQPAATHPRLLRALAFLLRTSQPWAYHFLGGAAGNNSDLLRGRFVLPLGDTHPTSTNFSALVAALPAALALLPPVAEWGSEELPGFGALLQSGAGGAGESFVALKASPSRGHNHGDQLSIHFAAHGARIVVDVMAGYLPRPPQEFWHNRACFGEDSNMDGAERLLAFARVPLQAGGAPSAAIAVGEVQSARLQRMPPRPPPNYLQVFPTAPLAAPLTYRRTALLLPAPPAEPGARDLLLLLDAHNASALGLPAYTTLLFYQQAGVVAAPLAGLGSGGVGFDMGNGTVATFAVGVGGAAVPLAAQLDRWDWPSEGNESATRLRVGPAGDGGGATTFFVTALYPDGSAMTPAGPPSTPSFGLHPGSGTLTITWRGGSVDVVAFSGALTDAGAGAGAGGDAPVATLRRGAAPPITLLRGSDLSPTRPQGDIGLNVLDAGYTFGEIPQQVVAQRGGDGAPPSLPWPVPHPSQARRAAPPASRQAQAQPPLTPAHPRLFFGADDVPALLARTQRAPYSSMLAQLQEDLWANRWGNAPADESDPGDMLYVARRAAFLSLLTGNSSLCLSVAANVTASVALGGPLGRGVWGNPNAFGLSLYTFSSLVAQVYDFCEPAWAPAFSARVSAALVGNADVITTSGGAAQNTDAASNWQGARGASALLAYIATDAPFDPAQRAAAANRTAAYLATNYGSGIGFNVESMGYQLYPSPNFVMPAGLALLRNTSGSDDLRGAAPGAPFLAVAPFVVAQRALGGHLVHADFSDDNGNWAPEGLAGLAFAWARTPATMAYLPAIRWSYDNLLGAAAGNTTWDRQSGGTMWSLLYYDEGVPPQNPQLAPLPFDDSRGNGKFFWRSAYGGPSDVVAGFYAKLRGPHGHAAPDLLGVRLVGLNNSWIIGGGRYGSTACGDIDCFERSQTTLYVKDPDAAWGLHFNKTSGALRGAPPLRGPSGGGRIAASAVGNTSDTGVSLHTRRLAVDFTRAAPAAAALVIVDTSLDGALAQFMTLSANAVALNPRRAGGAEEAGWCTTAPDGATMRVAALWPPAAALNLSTGLRPRAQPYLVLDGLYPNHTWVKAAYGAPCGGAPQAAFARCNFVFAVTLMRAGAGGAAGGCSSHPAVVAEGMWDGPSPSGNVSIGAWRVSVSGDDISGDDMRGDGVSGDGASGEGDAT